MYELTIAVLSALVSTTLARRPPSYDSHHNKHVVGPAPLPPPPYPTLKCTSICADFRNECGRKYGGCFGYCPGSPKPSFTDPGCPSTISVPTTSLSSTIPTITPSSISASTCTNQLCIDYINSCGRWYGGCYYDCPGSTTPVFTDPGCPSSATAATTTSQRPTIVTVSPSQSTCSNYLCADYVNSCGQTYGGCYYDCPGSTKPIFTDPGCPTFIRSSSSTTTTRDSYMTKITRSPSSVTKVPFPSSLPSSSTCTRFLCADYVNSCGRTYGGCYYDCLGSTKPVFTDPGCPSTTSSSSSSGGTSATVTIATIVTTSSSGNAAPITSPAPLTSPRGYGV